MGAVFTKGRHAFFLTIYTHRHRTDGGDINDLIVVCPSHQRPKEARELYDSFVETRTGDSLLRFGVWNEDVHYGSLPVTYITQERMTPRTNALAMWASERCKYIGWVADDNRFRTKGWDQRVMDELRRVPIVFGNDVSSPGSKPSHVFMDSRIVRSLGWLIHPGLRSTFFDDVWANLGVGPIDVSRPLFPQSGSHSGLGIGYLPDVIVEHLYTERDNSKDFMADMETYQTWLRNDCEDDIGRARRGKQFSSTSTVSSSRRRRGTSSPSTVR